MARKTVREVEPLRNDFVDSILQNSKAPRNGNPNPRFGGKRFDASRRTDFDNDNRQIPLFFHEKDQATPYYSYPDGENQSRINGNLDLLNKADWTASPLIGREDIISATITEYQPKYSSIVNNLIYSASQFGEIAKNIRGAENKFKTLLEAFNQNPIANSFQANKTGFSYTLPYLQLQSQDYATQFGAGENPQQNILQKAFGGVKDALINNPAFAGSGGIISGTTAKLVVGAGSIGQIAKDAGRALYPAINPADARDKYYQASSPVGYEFTFELLNTLDYEKAKFHKELIELWSHNMGMGNLRNSIVGDSPCIYTLEIDGIRWCPACKIDFSYVGNGNLIKIDGIPYPESYTCTLNIQEFFPPIRTIFHHYIKYGEKFTAINHRDDICSLLSSAYNAITNKEASEKNT